MSSILPLAAFHGESGPRRPYAGVARISGMDVVRIFGTSKREPRLLQPATIRAHRSTDGKPAPDVHGPGAARKRGVRSQTPANLQQQDLPGLSDSWRYAG